MSIVACEKCRVRYDLPDTEVARAGSSPDAACGFCGEIIAPPAGDSTDLLDELLSMSPVKPRPRELTTRAAPPPPPIEVIAVRTREEVARNGGRQVPLESGVLNVTALEPGSVEVIDAKVPPVAEAKPLEVPRPAREVKPLEIPRPAGEVKSPALPAPAVEVKPAVLPTPIAEVKPAVLPTPIAEVKPPVLPTSIAEVKPLGAQAAVAEVKAPPGMVEAKAPSVLQRRVANGRPSQAPVRAFDGSEPVSALPPLVSLPPRGLVQSYVELPPVAPARGSRGSRDSLDDGWDATSPAPPAPVVAVPARVAEAVPLPAVRLPWEILTEDTLAAEGETVPLATIPIHPSKLAPLAPADEQSALPAEYPGAAELAANNGDGAPDASAAAEDGGDEWATVPDESLADDVPGDDAADALHDAVTGEPSQVGSVSDVLDGAAVAAAVPPAWTAARFDAPLGSSNPSPVVNSAALSSSKQNGFVRRVGPVVGLIALVGLSVGLFLGLRVDKKSSRPAAADTTVGAARPAAPAGNTRDNHVKLNPALAEALAARNESPPIAAPASSAGSANSTFNNKLANIALARAISRARTCKKAGAPAVNAQAIVTFATNGNVVAVSVTGHKIGGTPLATCIGSTLKTARVPAFSGEAVTMKRPVKYK